MKDDDKVKVSILIPKNVLKKIDEDKDKEALFTRTSYINQILRRYLGFPSILDYKYKLEPRDDNFTKKKK